MEDILKALAGNSNRGCFLHTSHCASHNTIRKKNVMAILSRTCTRDRWPGPCHNLQGRLKRGLYRVWLSYELHVMNLLVLGSINTDLWLIRLWHELHGMGESMCSDVSTKFWGRIDIIVAYRWPHEWGLLIVMWTFMLYRIKIKTKASILIQKCIRSWQQNELNRSSYALGMNSTCINLAGDLDMFGGAVSWHQNQHCTRWVHLRARTNKCVHSGWHAWHFDHQHDAATKLSLDV